MASLRSPNPFHLVFHVNLKLLGSASITSQEITSIRNTFSFLLPKTKLGWKLTRQEEGERLLMISHNFLTKKIHTDGRQTPGAEDRSCTGAEGMHEISLLHWFPWSTQLLQELCNPNKQSYQRKGKTSHCFHLTSIKHLYSVRAIKPKLPTWDKIVYWPHLYMLRWTQASEILRVRKEKQVFI